MTAVTKGAGKGRAAENTAKDAAKDTAKDALEYEGRLAEGAVADDENAAGADEARGVVTGPPGVGGLFLPAILP